MSHHNSEKHLLLWYRPGNTNPREINLSIFKFRFIIVLLLVVFSALIIESVFYAALARRALDRERLLTDNEELRKEISRIAIFEQEFQQLKQFAVQLQRSLTEGADIERIIEATEAVRGDNESRDYPREDTWIPGSFQNLAEYLPDVLNNAQQGKEANWKGQYPWYWPVNGFLTRGFEVSLFEPARSHTGIDLAVPRGTPVKAVSDGRVVVADWTPRLGHRVILDHGGGAMSVYGHNEMILVYPHQFIRAGMPIALSGNSGVSTAPHLHFELWVNGIAIDPEEMLPKSGENENGQKKISQESE